MRWHEHGTFHSRVEAIEPGRRFAFRGSIVPDEAPRDGNTTLVEFTLSPEGSGTRLRVVESGFGSLDMPEAERASQVEGNIKGWQGAFATLEDYLTRIAA